MSALTRAPVTEHPILYSFRRCPYAMRARMAIAVSGVTVILREVSLRDKPAALIAASPKATVPVLVLPRGKVIDESLEIMHWALVPHDPLDWLSGDDPELVATNDGPFKAALDRYKYPHRYDIADATPYRDESLIFLTKLNSLLNNNDFLCGSAPRLSDIAIFPFIRQFAATDTGWFAEQSLPALHRWLSVLTTMPLFESIMTKVPKWQPGNAETLYP
jgi:glutathione S-transferase